MTWMHVSCVIVSRITAQDVAILETKLVFVSVSIFMEKVASMSHFRGSLISCRILSHSMCICFLNIELKYDRCERCIRSFEMNRPSHLFTYAGSAWSSRHSYRPNCGGDWAWIPARVPTVVFFALSSFSALTFFCLLFQPLFLSMLKL